MKYEKELIDFYNEFYKFDWENQEAYCNYLAQSFYYIRHSTKTLALAAGHLNFEDSKIFKRMVKHIGEELNHEMLCSKDLKALGKTVEDYTETPETQALYQSQYYKIQHENPLSYLGYVYVLESSCCMIVPKILREKLEPNYPRESYNFLKVHADEDPGHLTQLQEVLASLKPEDMETVAENMFFTMTSFLNLLKSCK